MNNICRFRADCVAESRASFYIHKYKQAVKIAFLFIGDNFTGFVCRKDFVSEFFIKTFGQFADLPVVTRVGDRFYEQGEIFRFAQNAPILARCFVFGQVYAETSRFIHHAFFYAGKNIASLVQVFYIFIRKIRDSFRVPIQICHFIAELALYCRPDMSLVQTDPDAYYDHAEVDDPHAHDGFFLTPTQEFQMVMERRHAENPSAEHMATD